MSKKNNKLSDTDITTFLGVPNTTLRDWKKNDPQNWRNKLYTFLKSHTYEELETKVSFLDIQAPDLSTIKAKL